MRVWIRTLSKGREPLLVGRRDPRAPRATERRLGGVAAALGHSGRGVCQGWQAQQGRIIIGIWGETPVYTLNSAPRHKIGHSQY